MRGITTLLVAAYFSICCQAQTADQAVLAVYRQLEKAEQTGDAALWIQLWAPDAITNAGKMKEYIRPRPEVHYRATKVLVQGDRAALIGEYGDGQYLSMRFVRVGGAWKIQDESFSNVALDPASLYALLPQSDGAFARAGSPWQNIKPVPFDTTFGKRNDDWQMRAVFDESFLYVRFELSAPLPAPGSEVPPQQAQRIDLGFQMNWPVLRINIPGALRREFVLNAGANIGDRATFDEQGNANSHFHYLAYSFRLERGDHEIFTAGADLSTSHPLIHVSDRFFDLKIPLKTLGIDAPVREKIVIGDATWPKSTVVSGEVPRFNNF